jgi:prepilin-type N-terminal cleavage/methylation domain-containing protein
MSGARASRGFTLLEVMIGLALLALGLVVLIKSTTGNIVSAKRAQMMGVATDLSRGKMYDIEEKLLKDGFTDTDQSEEGQSFDQEGWPEFKYSYKVEQIELPSFDQLQAIATGTAKDKGAGSGAGRGSGGGSGGGSDAGSDEPNGSFQDSALGGIISMLGGGFAGGSQDIDSKAGASFIQSYYQLIQETLKASIRKVTLTVKYDVLGEDTELTTVAFFTDSAGLNKGLLGAVGGGSDDSGSGSGSGSGPGSAPKPPSQNPRTPGGGSNK